MNIHAFTFCGVPLQALGSGALYWPDANLLVVSDLHLGKSERIARRTRQLLPPYEVTDTLIRLEEALDQTGATTVICLGDSFDDLTAGHGLAQDHSHWITRLMAGRKWIWIEGNHDPGPLEFGGSHLAHVIIEPLTFRHIARADAKAEISGHYHPKASLHLRGRTITRPSFLVDKTRLILPAFGTYTGGLHSSSDTLGTLMGPDAYAILTGTAPCAVPMPR
ncbi:ligase-associated DNA damage response endonuclease PdeM [Litoreibacter sp.]|nr:ligase-associated DNA damage response endonuclease PdeM [Litoreibacter sp.]